MSGDKLKDARNASGFSEISNDRSVLGSANCSLGTPLMNVC